jgi:hypothetical protein
MGQRSGYRSHGSEEESTGYVDVVDMQAHIRTDRRRFVDPSVLREELTKVIGQGDGRLAP